jgi:hypothetical protein
VLPIESTREHLTVRRATAADVDWIVALSTRVQDALTASGSLQKIGPPAPATDWPSSTLAER